MVMLAPCQLVRGCLIINQYMACRCYIKVINNCQALDRGMLALGMSKDLKEGVLFMCEPLLTIRATGCSGLWRFWQRHSPVSGCRLCAGPTRPSSAV